MGKLNNLLLNDECFKERFKKEIKTFLQVSENVNIIQQNIWNILKVVLRRRFIVIIAYIKDHKKSLNYRTKNLEKHEYKPNKNQKIARYNKNQSRS